MFSVIKKFIAAKYPAFQIDVRRQSLRSALEREVYYGHVELVSGCSHSFAKYNAVYKMKEIKKN
jgi:hypothetical protein